MTGLDTCHFCGEGSSMLSIDGKARVLTGVNHKLNLISEDKLWSYIYYQNVLDLSQETGSEQGLKLSFCLASGEHFAGEGVAQDLHQTVQLCNRCLLHFEELEGLYKNMESLKKLIDQKIKAINQVKSRQFKSGRLWKVPRFQMTFSGAAEGKENVKKALEFLGEMTEKMGKVPENGEISRPSPPPPVVQTQHQAVGQPPVYQNGSISVTPATVNGGTPPAPISSMPALTDSRTINGFRIRPANTGFPQQQQQQPQQIPITVSSGNRAGLPVLTQAPGGMPQQPARYITMAQCSTANGKIILIPVMSHGHGQQLVPQAAGALSNSGPTLPQAPQTIGMVNGNAQLIKREVVSTPPPAPVPAEQIVVKPEIAPELVKEEIKEEPESSEENPSSQEMQMETDEQFDEDTTDYGMYDEDEESSDLVISNVRSNVGLTFLADLNSSSNGTSNGSTPPTPGTSGVKRKRRSTYIRVNCSECGKSVTSHNLPAHMRVHTGEKPYHCNICDNDFRYNSSFYRHLREVHEVNDGVHQRDKFLYKCSICGKICRSSDKLEEHMKEIHGERSEASVEQDDTLLTALLEPNSNPAPSTSNQPSPNTEEPHSAPQSTSALEPPSTAETISVPISTPALEPTPAPAPTPTPTPVPTA